MRKEKRLLALRFGASALYFLIIIYWSVGIRFNAAPDEYSHFFLVEFILKNGALPHQWIDPRTPFAGIASGVRYHSRAFWYYGMPNIHALGAAATAYGWIDLAKLPASPLAVRSFNWLSSIPFFLSLASIAQRGMRLGSPSANGSIFALFAALLVALIPQVVFIFAYFNSDAFGLTALTIALALLLRTLETPTIRHSIQCGIALGLFLCAKMYFLPAMGLLAIVAGAFIAERRAWPIKSRTAICLGIALVVAVPILTATWAWYGDASGMQGQRDFYRFYGDDPQFMKGTCFVLCDAQWANLPMLWWWLSIAFKSFFYDLGWVEIVLPVRAYQLFFLPLCLGLVAISISVLRPRRAPVQHWQKAVALGLWILLLGLLAANLLGSQRLLPQPQGRYLYAVLPFIPLLVGIGIGRPKTGRIVTFLLPLTTMVMLAFDAAGAKAVHASLPRPIESSPGFRDLPGQGRSALPRPPFNGS